jgi:hypothetical protein
MTRTEARIEVLAAALRAISQAPPAEQSQAAAALFLRHVEPLARHRLRDAADQAAAAEISSVLLALAK